MFSFVYLFILFINIFLISLSMINLNYFSYILILILSQSLPVIAQNSILPLDKIKLPPGFSISLWAAVPDVHALTLGHKGTVFAGSKTSGKVYAITTDNGARQVKTIAQGLKMPTGVAFRNGALYVSTISRILRFNNIEENLDQPPQPIFINHDFPTERFQGWKFIAFGPDDLLYVSVGAPCNICQPDPSQFALISRINPDDDSYEVYAQGIRHSLGFDWHPETKALWFTDIGRDWMGDDLPADELNVAPEQGMHFGFPYCHANDVLDPKFGAKRDCSQSTSPAIELDAHVVPQGMRFYTGNMFPAEYRNQILVAQHGSWNRRTQRGFQLELIRIQDNKAIQREIFAEGWLQDGKAWGKPVDVLVMPDGALLVSDDFAGVIYRISYTQP